MAPLPLEKIQPGDCLLYSGTGLFNRIIQFKTWSKFAHCELYDGHGWSLASRNGQGVDRYETRLHGLVAIYRLRVPFSMEGVRDYHEGVEGQGYDWWGLLSFTSAKLQGAENFKQFCSEYMARAYRRGIGAVCVHPDAQRGDRHALHDLGLDPFGGENADAIAPAAFARSPLFKEVV